MSAYGPCLPTSWQWLEWRDGQYVVVVETLPVTSSNSASTEGGGEDSSHVPDLLFPPHCGAT